MTPPRITAWGRELQAVHRRLREALEIVREAVDDGTEPEGVSADLRLFCSGFCVALVGHHTSEDGSLFPLVIERRKELAPVVAKLKQDHNMLAYLIQELDRALHSGSEPTVLLQHLDGIGAVMETHFRYEERELVPILDAVTDQDLDKVTLFGPIA